MLHDYYFDITQIKDFSQKSNDFFECVANSDDLQLFETKSIQIIVKEAWKKHEAFFICFFTVPYVILTIAYFIWSNFATMEKEVKMFKDEE